MDELGMFNEDIDKFLDMNDDFDLTPKDYYDEFSKMCVKYSDSSIVPYSLVHELITEEFPCEEYYMQASASNLASVRYCSSPVAL